LEKLYERLEIINQYNRFYNLKKRIIEPSINDINKSTNLSIEWDIVKKGKVITGLIFIFQENVVEDKNRKEKVLDLAIEE
jgi:plasmid replication initiation protein